MKIGIIEICVEGHYVVVNALIKTYLSSGKNEVLVFTTPEIKALLAAQNEDPKLSFILMEKHQKAGDFIHSMNTYHLDRIHYTTVSKFYKDFYQFNPDKGCLEFFHFHNIDIWFNSAFTEQAKRLYSVVKLYKSSGNLFNHLKYSVKEVLWDFYRKKLIKKLMRKGVTFIILSEAQKRYLETFAKGLKTLIFPSLIFENDMHTPALADSNKRADKIRVCIPGAVIQSKKEYDRLLAVLEADTGFYRKHYVFDLLGRVPDQEKGLLDRIVALEKQGLEIYFYRSFIDVNEFDLKLYESDIILSNMHMSDSKTVQNKETAAVYQMIRGAKPGIFPAYFMLDDCFDGSVVKFTNYDTLDHVFKNLAEDHTLLERLQSHAKNISLDFTPGNLLNRLIPD